MNWKILKSSYAFVCPWLKVRKDHSQMFFGVEMVDFYVVEANDSSLESTEDIKIHLVELDGLHKLLKEEKISEAVM